MRQTPCDKTCATCRHYKQPDCAHPDIPMIIRGMDETRDDPLVDGCMSIVRGSGERMSVMTTPDYGPCVGWSATDAELVARYRVALADAIRRPLGVTPESAEGLITNAELMQAEERRPRLYSTASAGGWND